MDVYASENSFIQQVGGLKPDGGLDMGGILRPDNHIAKSNGDGTGYWADDSPSQSELLNDALQSKHKEIDAAMSENVCTEFQSSALGSIHSYDCRGVDQKNIAQAIRIAGVTGNENYLAKPSGQFFSMTPHSLVELNIVDADMFSHINSNRDIARRKKGEAVLAHDNSDIDAINAVDVNDWV